MLISISRRIESRERVEIFIIIEWDPAQQTQKGFKIMRDQFFVLLVTIACILGCQSKTDLVEKSEPETPSVERLDAKSDSEPAESKTNSEPRMEAGRGIASSLPIQDATPEEVCTEFLKLLQQGDVENAQKLITRKSLAMTLRFDLPLTFPGDENAKILVRDAQFATSKGELAQVMCEFNEVIDGRTSTIELGWMLKQEIYGWRICGMLMPTSNDKPLDFISFENADDLGRIKSMLSSNPKENDLQVLSD